MDYAITRHIDLIDKSAQPPQLTIILHELGQTC